MLIQQLSTFGVFKYFHEAKGISNIYGKDKTHLAEDYMNKHQLNPDSVVFIGDTLHDKEVADEIGVETILVSNGHQSGKRLSLNGNLVINDLKNLLISE